MKVKSTYSRLVMAAVVVALAVAVAVSQTVGKGAGFAGGGFPFGGHMLSFFADYLDLTDAQQAQVKNIVAKEKPVVSPLIAHLSQSNLQLRQIAEAGNVDEAKVRSLAAQQSQTLTELIVQKTRIEAELFQVLTPEQKTKLDAFLAKRQQRFMNHMQPGVSPQ